MMTKAMMTTSGFASRGHLLRQARQDANWSLATIAEHSGVTEEKLRALESDSEESITIAGVTTVDLGRLEELFHLPEASLLQENNPYLHRTVVFQQFITPRGLHCWIDLLNRFTLAHATPDNNGITETSSALPNLREMVEQQLKLKVLKLVQDGSISQGRAKELLNLTAWDDLTT